MDAIKGLTRVAALVLAGSFGGCSFEHSAGVDYEEMVTKQAGHEVTGVVHAETWTPMFFYVLPLLPRQSPERAQELAIQKAKSMGADAVTDVRLHVETHMPFFFLAGWTENHVSATAVRFR